MTNIPWAGAKHIVYAALAVSLSATTSSAAASAQDETSALRNAVKPGDSVAITQWSGPKLKGEVIEITDCSLVIQRAGKTLDLPSAAIKKVRRYPTPKQNLGAKGLLAFAETCDVTDCAPTAVAVVGLAALFQGVKDLGRQSKVVYAATRVGSSRACTAEQIRFAPRRRSDQAETPHRND